MDSIRGAILKDIVVETLTPSFLRQIPEVSEETFEGERVFVVHNLRTLNDVHSAFQKHANQTGPDQHLFKFKEYCLRGFDVKGVYTLLAQMINTAYYAWGETPIDVVVGRGSGSGKITCDLLKSLFEEQGIDLNTKYHFGYNWSDLAKLDYVSQPEGGKVFFISMGLVLDFGQTNEPLRLKPGDLCFPKRIVSRIDM